MAKWGAGHLAAWLRAGSKELAQALPATPQSIRPVEEPGLAGNPTPQEVLNDKGVQQGYDEWLNERQQQAGRSQSNDLGLDR